MLVNSENHNADEKPAAQGHSSGREVEGRNPSIQSPSKTTLLTHRNEPQTPTWLWLSLTRPPPGPGPPHWVGRPSFTTTQGGRRPHPPVWGRRAWQPLSWGTSLGCAGPSGGEQHSPSPADTVSPVSLAPRPGAPGAALPGEVPCTRASDRWRPRPLKILLTVH